MPDNLLNVTKRNEDMSLKLLRRLEEVLTWYCTYGPLGEEREDAPVAGGIPAAHGRIARNLENAHEAVTQLEALLGR